MRSILLAVFLVQMFFTSPAQELMVDWEYWKQEILAMRDADQALRKQIGDAKRSKKKQSELGITMAALDSQHYLMLKQYADSVMVFPDAKQVGDETCHAFWLLIMHQDDHVEMQELVLSWMQALRAKKSYQKRDIAFLDDRINVNKGRCQTYGTQFDWIGKIKEYKAFPICNEKKLPKLRKKMKLMPFEKQAAQENK